MDAGCLQNPTLAATCCSSCCCNVPATHGHCQILSNTGWRSNSIGFTFRHPRGFLYAKRRRGRRSNLVEASIVNDVAVVAVAAVAATVLPMCLHFLKNARASETSESSCSSTSFAPVSSSMAGWLEAVGLSSSSVISDDAPASLRLGERDTVELQSGLTQTQLHASALNRKDDDAGIGEGWLRSSGTVGSVEGGTRCAGSGPRLVTVASSCISPAILLESVDKECRTTDPDSEHVAVTGYSGVRTGYTRAGLLADVDINTVNAIVPLKVGFSSEREAIARGVSASDVDIIYSSTNEPNMNELDSVPRDNELQVNGVSAAGGRFSNYGNADALSNEDRHTLSSPVFEQSSRLSGSNSFPAASLNNKSFLEEDDCEADGDQTVAKKFDALLHHDSAKALAPQTKTETSGLYLPHGDTDERTNGSCILLTTGTGQDRNKVGNAGLDENSCQADARLNGSVFSITGSPNVKSSTWNSRKQRRRYSLGDLWEEFLRARDGSMAEILSPERYETLYQKLLSAERIRDCLEVFENMDKLGILDMSQVYHTKFFNAFKRHQAVKEAFRFVKLIKNPPLSTYNQLLSVCASAKNVEGAFEVLSSLEKAGLKADCIIYTTVISACAKAGKVDLIFQVFHEMVSNGVEPNIHTYGALIDGCARAGEVGKAFGVYGIVRSKKLKPDRVIFNSLITACGRSGALERAFDVLSEMNAEPIPIQPNHVTIGALIKACTRAGEVSRAYEVYRMMQDKGIQGSAEAYTEAVHACSRNGDLHTALEIYKDMKNAHIQPDEVFFSALIDVAGQAGQLDACFEILHEMKQRGLEPGVIAYSAVMGACSSTGSWERGLSVYKEMLAASLSPNLSTMNALITVLCGNGQLKEALTILQEIRHGGMVPNYITYRVLLEASEKEGDIDTAFNLYKKATSEGVVPTIEMCESIMGLCLKQIWKLSSGPTPTSSLSSIAGHSFCQKCITWALSVYRETVRSGVVPTIRAVSQLLGCLRLPRMAEDIFYGNNGAVQHGSNEQLSLIDGFGIYDPRAMALFEEAAALGVVPSFSYTDGPIIINAAPMPVFIAEVCLLTLLRGLKHRNAAGARLPSLTILLAGKDKVLVNSTSHQKKVIVLTRTSQAVAALLRRLKLNFHGHESSGKLKVTSAAIRHWLQPKTTKQGYRVPMWQLDPGQQQFSLGKRIAEQQQMLRYRETSGWPPIVSQPTNDKDIQGFPSTNGSLLQDSSKSSTNGALIEDSSKSTRWGDQDNSYKATDPQEIEANPQILSKIV